MELVVVDQPTGLPKDIWEQSEWLFKNPPPGARILLLSSKTED